MMAMNWRRMTAATLAAAVVMTGCIHGSSKEESRDTLGAPAKADHRDDSSKAAVDVLETLRTRVRARMKENGVPGVGIGIIRDGKVILAEGFGTRNANTGLPINAQTTFLIGSTTKAFTTTVLAMLVDEGRVAWRSPVQNYLPKFAVGDEYVSKHLTVEDLVTHRSGIPGGQVKWFGSPKSRAELVYEMRSAKLNAGFRELYQYNNEMFMVAGFLAGEVAGSTYEDLVQKRILDPLGMTNTRFADLSEVQQPADANIAFPHEVKEGVAKRIEFQFEGTAIRPAGTLASNIDDMLKWVHFNLNQGSWQGQQLLSRPAFKELITSHMHMPSRTDRPNSTQTYGYGWILEQYKGHRVVHHAGGSTGTLVEVMFLPDENIGIVVYMNALTGRGFPDELAFYIVDLLGDAKSK